MPVPKRRHSNSRTNKRRANWKLSAPNVVLCSHCHQPKLPHRICPNCGYYDEREVMVVKET
ncbi:MAG: 50S ribosomal protein L32 [Candidatus Edwardsbacteria bacterium]